MEKWATVRSVRPQAWASEFGLSEKQQHVGLQNPSSLCTMKLILGKLPVIWKLHMDVQVGFFQGGPLEIRFFCLK